MNTILLNTISDGKVVIKRGEGGGNSGGGDAPCGGSSYEYIDISSISLDSAYRSNVISLSILAKYRGNFGFEIAPPGRFTYPSNSSAAFNSTFALCLDLSLKIVIDEQTLTIGELIGQVWDLASLPRITKEEFYNLNA